MPSPTDDDLNRLVNGDPFDSSHPLLRLWMRPVIPLLPVLAESKDKPIGQYTMTELLTWITVVGYIAGSIMLAETLALNVLRVAVRGR